MRLSHVGRLPHDVIGVVGERRRRGLAEPVGEVAFEAVGRGHATCPPSLRRTGIGSRSVPSADRSAARARERRDWAVPSGMPSVVASIGTDIPT